MLVVIMVFMAQNPVMGIVVTLLHYPVLSASSFVIRLYCPTQPDYLPVMTTAHSQTALLTYSRCVNLCILCICQFSLSRFLFWVYNSSVLYTHPANRLI